MNCNHISDKPVIFTVKDYHGYIYPSNDSEYLGWVGYLSPPLNNGLPYPNIYIINKCDNGFCYNITFKKKGKYSLIFASDIILDQNTENIKILKSIFLLTTTTLSDVKINNQISYIQSFPYGVPGDGQNVFPYLKTEIYISKNEETYSFNFEINVDTNKTPQDKLNYIIKEFQILIESN